MPEYSRSGYPHARGRDASESLYPDLEPLVNNAACDIMIFEKLQNGMFREGSLLEKKRTFHDVSQRCRGSKLHLSSELGISQGFLQGFYSRHFFG